MWCKAEPTPASCSLSPEVVSLWLSQNQWLTPFQPVGHSLRSSLAVSPRWLSWGPGHPPCCGLGCAHSVSCWGQPVPWGFWLALQSSLSAALGQVRQTWLLFNVNTLTETNILGEERISGLLPLKLLLKDLNQCFFSQPLQKSINLSHLRFVIMKRQRCQ